MEKILIIGPSWVGDMVMMQSLCMKLKQKDPDVLIDVVASAWSLPVLKRMPEVRHAITLDMQHGKFGFGNRWRLGKRLSSEGYCRAIVVPRTFKSALVPLIAGIPIRTGYRGEMRYLLLNDIRRLDKDRFTQTVQRYVALALERELKATPSVSFPGLEVSVEGRDQLVARFGLKTVNLVALLSGAEYGSAKQWPPEYYAEVGTALSENGAQVVILGSEKDNLVGERIVSYSGGALMNLCGKTSLEEVVDLLSLCRVAVTNDSGLMHVAAAVGTRVIAIYGSSTPDYTPPLTDRASILCQRLDCSPCFDRECRFGHTKCLTGISPRQVLQQLQL